MIGNLLPGNESDFNLAEIINEGDDEDNLYLAEYLQSELQQQIKESKQMVKQEKQYKNYYDYGRLTNNIFLIIFQNQGIPKTA